MNSQPTVPRVATAVLVLAGVAGCWSGDRSTALSVTVSDSSGVQIVQNVGLPGPLDLEVTEVAALTSPDSALTAVPWGVAADPNTGQVYVIDQTSPRVLVFDRNGRYVRTLGHPGEGPGEFVRPNAASIDPYGALTVWDVGRGVLSRWSSEGHLLNEQRSPINYWGPGFYERPGALITVTSATSGELMDQQIVEVRGNSTSVVHSVARRLIQAELPCGSLPASPLFEPDVIWSARGDTIQVLVGPAYRIDTFVGGELVRSLRSDRAPVQVTEQMAARRATWEYRGMLDMCGVDPEAFVRAVGYAETTPAIQTITSSPDGRLWVSRTLEAVPPIAVDVFDASGRLEGTLHAPGLPLAFLSPTRFIAMHVREATDEVILTLHDLQEGSPEETAGASVVPRHPGVSEFRDCADCPVIVSLPKGEYLMGAPSGEVPASANPTRPEWTEQAEKPQVPISITGFAIGKYEVTFAEWDRCVEAGGCTHRPDDRGWGRKDRPIIHVARADAEQYIAWLRSVTGQPYRLPSEAEWEYAARAGSKTARWWGDQIGSDYAVCDRCGSSWDNRSTAPVGSFPANPFGLHDMLGNVSEWVADCWHESHDGAPPNGAPRVDSSPWWEDGVCTRPVRRGGAWSHYTWTVRAAHRTYYRDAPDGRWNQRASRSTGFRVARDVGASE